MHFLEELGEAAFIIYILEQLGVVGLLLISGFLIFG